MWPVAKYSHHGPLNFGDDRDWRGSSPSVPGVSVTKSKFLTFLERISRENSLALARSIVRSCESFGLCQNHSQLDNKINNLRKK